MLRFSTTGLHELNHLIQQVKPFISEQDYILLSTIANSIREDRVIAETDYIRLIRLVEAYIRAGNCCTPPCNLSNSFKNINTSPSTSQPIYEEISHINLLNLQLFLLSYSGVDAVRQENLNSSIMLEYRR